MDALKQARADMGYYEEWADKSPVVPSPKLLIGSAQAYAAIEQAEQLKRIAGMMESYLAIYADPAVLSDIKE